MSETEQSSEGFWSVIDLDRQACVETTDEAEAWMLVSLIMEEGHDCEIIDPEQRSYFR